VTSRRAVNWVMVTGYQMLPGVYDAMCGPMMRLLGEGKPGVAATPGNVFDAVPGKEAVHERWPHVWS
jgi:hypothetical protein